MARYLCVRDSIQFCLGFPDHRLPFGGFLLDQFLECFRRAADRFQAGIVQACLYIRHLNDGIQLRIQALDDIRGRPGRHEDTVPGEGFECRHASFGHGRYIRQQ